MRPVSKILVGRMLSWVLKHTFLPQYQKIRMFEHFWKKLQPKRLRNPLCPRPLFFRFNIFLNPTVFEPVIVEPKFFLTKRFLGLYIVSNPKYFWPNNFLIPNLFGTKHFFGHKIFFNPRFFSRNFFSSTQPFSNKLFFDTKFFWPKIFSPKILFWQFLAA